MRCPFEVLAFVYLRTEFGESLVLAFNESLRKAGEFVVVCVSHAEVELPLRLLRRESILCVGLR